MLLALEWFASASAVAPRSGKILQAIPAAQVREAGAGELPRCYSKWRHLPSKVLAELLTETDADALNAVVLSMIRNPEDRLHLLLYALKLPLDGQLPRGCRTVSALKRVTAERYKEVGCLFQRRRAEFMAAFAFHGTHCSCSAPPSLTAQLSPRCGPLVDDEGRVDWTRGVGVYYLTEAADGVLTVTHRGTGKASKVPLDSVSGAAASTVSSKWRIVGNWQEQLAELTNGTVSVFLHQVAPQSPFTTPRRQLPSANASLALGQPTLPKSSHLRQSLAGNQKTKAPQPQEATVSPGSPLKPRCLATAFASMS